MVIKFAERADSELVPGIIFAALERRNRAFLAALSANRDSLRFRHEIEEALREIEKNWDEEAEALARYQQEHGEEIAAQQHLPFELTVVSSDEKDELAELLPLVKSVPVEAAIEKQLIKPEQRSQLSTLQRIASLTVTERVQLAMRGSREERMILIRDGVRVVAVAVLESPKVSEQEMESFANMKNVQEVVLRGIATAPLHEDLWRGQGSRRQSAYSARNRSAAHQEPAADRFEEPGQEPQRSRHGAPHRDQVVYRKEQDS